MYKNEREWQEAIKNDDLVATVNMLQNSTLPDVPPSPKLPHIRRELLSKYATQQWWPLLSRGAGALISFTLLILLVGFFWMNQANQAASSPEEPDTAAGPVANSEQEAEATAVPSTTPEVPTEAQETPLPTPTVVIPTDQVWWHAIRRHLTDRNTNLTPYEIEVGYKLETVDTAIAQVFLAPQNWETAVDLYPFSEPVTISADDDNVSFTILKEMDQFFQEIPPRSNSLVVTLSLPEAGPSEPLLSSAAWKNFVDTEYFAGEIFIAPESNSALDVFDWEFDNNYFSVESPSRRFGGTEIVTFVVNYHYQLTQASNAYVKLVLVDRTNGNRRLDSAFVRANGGVGLVTARLEFDPAQVNGSTDLAIESFIVREGLESPNGTAGGWRYVP